MKSRYITHVVSAGDTIQQIGYNYGVDWKKLAIINGLEYPYIDSEINSTLYENTDEVAKIGDRLVIPTTDLNIPYKTNNSSKELEEYTFGCDIDLFSLEIEEKNGINNLESKGELCANPDGDIKLATGIENLRQQLILRLGTPKGSLILHPDFGSDLLKHVGATLTFERLIKIKLCIEECLLNDFRVLSINDMKATFKNSGGLFIDLIVHPIEPYSDFRIGKTFNV